MGSLLMYQGLPGGPTEIKLADEIPRHCLCGRCGMLTLSMYQDPNDHMFCETCLKEQSTEERSSIYCPYERKDVGIEDMFQARDLVMILRDQYVDCPNQPDCTAKLPLENLHDHYVTCKPRVQCSRCHESIETKQWKNHMCTSVIQGSVPNTKERTGASKKTLKDGGHQEKKEPSMFSSREPRERKQNPIQKLRSALAASTAPYREALGWTTEASQLDRQVASAKRGTATPMQDSGSENCGPAATQECEYCHRKVKETNMQKHVQNCTRAPRPCVYCDEPFLPEDMKSHLEVCRSNPDNVEERKPAAATAGVTSGTPDTNSTGPAGFHTDSGTSSEDLPMWLQYLASGNWLNAYVAMEESLRTSRLQDTDRYAVYAPAFVRLKQRACVEDFLGEPCPVQPLDCLMAALFVRAYLPRDVLSTGKPVTWERALQYLPHFLASRLSEEALAYLCAYPVFLDENGSQCTTECTSAASAQSCLNPELSVTSEETPSRPRCEAHKGTKTEPGTSNASLEEKATPSPNAGKEYPSVASESSSILPRLSSYLSKCLKEPTPSDALFQESTRKPNVELKRDDDPLNEDAERTVYLDVPPGTSLRPRNSPGGIADTHASRKQDMLFAAIQGLPRRQPDHLRNAYVYSILDEVNTNPASRNTAADSCQHIEELQGALSRISIAPSSTESTPAGGVADLQPERPGRWNNYNKEKAFPPITCKELVDCQEKESRISCTSYTERECDKDRYHGLSVQAPCTTFQARGNPTEQYHRNESSNMSFAERFVRQCGRSRGVRPLQHSPALNEHSSSSHLVRSRGRGVQMPNTDTSRTRYINGETSREALRAHLECKENFENSEHEL